MASASTSHSQAEQTAPVAGPTPDIAAPDAPRPLVVVGVMTSCMLGPFINILDINVVNVTLPRIMSGLGRTC